MKALNGFELGGPSQIFRPGGLLPVYPHLKSLDNANFATSTIWEPHLQDGGPFNYLPDRTGTQYIREATDLHGIPDEQYDLVLSSHMLEHTANPLKVISEINRILKPDGKLLMIVPHRDGVLGDRQRELVSIEHLKEDFVNDTPESELGQENLKTRQAHVHVFDCSLVAQVLDVGGFEIRVMQAVLPFNIIAMATKSPQPHQPHLLCNEKWLDSRGEHLFQSPFATDRQG